MQDEDKKIVITGSNAILLSKEFGTRLTGRYKAFEVYPFSFSEFLIFKGLEVKKEDWYEEEVLTPRESAYLDKRVEEIEEASNDLVKLLTDKASWAQQQAERKRCLL